MTQVHLFKLLAALGEKWTRLQEKFGFLGLIKRKLWTRPLKKSTSATPFCKVCFQPISTSRLCRPPSNPRLCDRCQKEMNPQLKAHKTFGVPAFYLYDYNETIRGLLYQLKGCGDYEMGQIFFCHQANVLHHRFWNYVIVPAPSYFARDEERGFNHVVTMFAELRLPIIRCLEKTKDIKQADLSAAERTKIGKSLRMKNARALYRKNVLLVDDVMTTGSTIKACISLLQKARPKRIVVLTMARVARH